MVCFVHVVVVTCVNKKMPWGPPRCEHFRLASQSILRFLEVAKLRLDVNLFIAPYKHFFILCTCLLERHQSLFGLLLSRRREGW